MATRIFLARMAVSSSALLVVLGGLASAQGVLPFEPETGLEPIEVAETFVVITFEGCVYDPSGAPAEGAVVVTSAGGQAVTDWNGSYRLEAQVPALAEGVQITAVGRTGKNLLSSTRVPLLAAPESV
jgi:hypothetical protein